MLPQNGNCGQQVITLERYTEMQVAESRRKKVTKAGRESTSIMVDRELMKTVKKAMIDRDIDSVSDAVEVAFKLWLNSRTVTPTTVHNVTALSPFQSELVSRLEALLARSLPEDVTAIAYNLRVFETFIQAMEKPSEVDPLPEASKPFDSAKAKELLGGSGDVEGRGAKSVQSPRKRGVR